MRLILFLFLSYCLPLSAQVPGLVTDPSGHTQYRCPAGWTAQVQQQQQLFLWTAEARPGDPESPGLLVAAMPATSVAPTPALLQDFLQQLVGTVEVLRTEQAGADQLQWFRASIEGQQAKVAGYYTYDPSSGYVFCSYFSALPADFGRLGGMRLLCASLSRDCAAYAEKTGDTLAQDSPAAALTGNWMQVVSYQTGEVYEEPVSGKISYGSYGYGHLLELRQNGSYRLTYSYDNFTQGCENKAAFTEEGRFEQQGQWLELQPTAYDGAYVVCGQRTAKQKQQPPVRRFQLQLSADGQTLRLHGQPFEYTISLEYDAANQPYFEETFQKQ